MPGTTISIHILQLWVSQASHEVDHDCHFHDTEEKWRPREGSVSYLGPHSWLSRKVRFEPRHSNLRAWALDTWQYPINGLAFITVTVEPTYMVAQLLHFAVEEAGKRFHNQPGCEGDWSYYQGKEWAPGQLWDPVCRTLYSGSETELPDSWETKTTGPVVLNKKLKITKGAYAPLPSKKPLECWIHECTF